MEKLSIKNSFIVLLITAFLSVIGNYFGPGIPVMEAIPGAVILILVSIVGIILGEVIPLNIPNVAYIVTIASIITIPSFPGAAFITEKVSKVNFLALTTPILAYAGIYTGKNLDSLKESGWRIAILAIFVMFGTFLLSAIIANFILKLLGQI